MFRRYRIKKINRISIIGCVAFLLFSLMSTKPEAEPAAVLSECSTHQPSALRTETRLAFIVAIADYSVPDLDLRNPVNDARAIDKTLRSLGFVTVLSINQTGRQIRDCHEIARKLANDVQPDVSVFYASSHGVQVNERNFIAARDVKDAVADDPGLIALEDITDGLSKDTGSLLVFLDACRTAPFNSEVRPGLASVVDNSRSLQSSGDEKGFQAMSSAPGAAASLFFAYATAPNTVAYDGDGRLSPFTAAFVELAPTPGWPLERVMAEVRNKVGEATNWRQTPWTRSSLSEPIFLSLSRSIEQVDEESRQRAARALEMFRSGDRHGALQTALSALPLDPTQAHLERFREAHLALNQIYRGRAVAIPLTASTTAVFNGAGDRLVTVAAGDAVVSTIGPMALWDGLNGRHIKDLLNKEALISRADGTVATVAGPHFSPDGSQLFTIHPQTGEALLWDGRTGEMSGRFEFIGTDRYGERTLLCLSSGFLSNNSIFAFCDNRLRVADLTTQQVEKLHEWQPGSKRNYNQAHRYDDRLLITVWSSQDPTGPTETDRLGYNTSGIELIEPFARRTQQQIRFNKASWRLGSSATSSPDGTIWVMGGHQPGTVLVLSGDPWRARVLDIPGEYYGGTVLPEGILVLTHWDPSVERKPISLRDDTFGNEVEADPFSLPAPLYVVDSEGDNQAGATAGRSLLFRNAAPIMGPDLVQAVRRELEQFGKSLAKQSALDLGD